MNLQRFRDNGKLKLASGVLAISLAIAGGVTATAATGAQGTPMTGTHGAKVKALKGIRHDELNAVANELHISVTQLESDLRGGKTLAQEAQSANPPVSTADLTATIRTALKTDLDKAVANKQITADRENAMLTRFDPHADKLLNHTWGAHKKTK